jgi:hypothetical protein
MDMLETLVNILYVVPHKVMIQLFVLVMVVVQKLSVLALMAIQDHYVNLQYATEGLTMFVQVMEAVMDQINVAVILTTVEHNVNDFHVSQWNIPRIIRVLEEVNVYNTIIAHVERITLVLIAKLQLVMKYQVQILHQCVMEEVVVLTIMFVTACLDILEHCVNRLFAIT